MTALRNRLRARLLVEHLEDRAQPALLTPSISVLALDPVANSTPAIVGSRVAGTPTSAAASSPASSSAAPQASLIILFGPDDQAEFAILVEPVQVSTITAVGSPFSSFLPSENAVRFIILAEAFPGETDTGPFHSREKLVDSNPGPNLPMHPAATATPTPAGPMTVPDPLLVPVGYVYTANLPEAPMPRAVEDRVAPPAVETAPPPREVGPAKIVPLPVSFVEPEIVEDGATANAATTKPVTAATAAAVDAIMPTALEQPEAASASWGWFGALAAALSAGGYWMLRYSRFARALKLSPRANVKLLKWIVEPIPLARGR